MYLTLLHVNLQASVAVFVVWLVAVAAVTRLATRPASRLPRAARTASVAAVLGIVLTLIRVGLVAMVAGYGWQFATDRKLVTLLVVALPAVAVAALTLPRLWALARSATAGQESPVAASAQAARSVRIALPVQLAAAGSAFGMFEVFLPPHRSWWGNAAGYGGALALVGVLLWWRRRARMARLVGAREPVAGRIRRFAVTTVAAVVVIGAGGALVAASKRTSRLPDTYPMTHEAVDLGGGPAVAHASHQEGTSGGRSVTALHGPRDAEPDRRFTLTAQQKDVTLSSGRTLEAWTFNGQVPGPQLRVRQGDLVEVTLVNRLTDAPVTLHWHGVDVPNAEDGVAGVTQDAVQPNERHTYRFVADEVGTRWYHSHQQGSEQVRRGLFGALVIEPRVPKPVNEDLVAVYHEWGGPDNVTATFGASDTLQHRAVPAGHRVRVRLINTSNEERTFGLTGVSYRVTAWDGTDVHRPTPITGQRLALGAGGRYDLEFTMPDSPVRLSETSHPSIGMSFSPTGRDAISPDLGNTEFNPLSYGSPARTAIRRDADFDREFELVFDDWLGFYNGQFTLRQAVNGAVFPDVPTHLVREGDLVKMRFVNRGESAHPMHLHGHHVLVLSRNGRAVTGSPVWLDTVNVRSGEVWEVGFMADNPGLWMDHCHNFRHTELGMVLHLAYEGVTTPFLVGGHAGNHPE